MKAKTPKQRYEKHIKKAVANGFKRSSVSAHKDDWPKIRKLETSLRKKRSK